MRVSVIFGPIVASVILAAFITSERIIRPVPKDGKVHVVYWEKWTGFEGDAMRDTVNAYNQSQNRISVDLLTVSAIENKTLLAVAGGTPPDVAGLYGPNVPQYAEDRAVVPLDDYCRNNGISRDQYIPVYWDICEYRGHQYALPTVPASTALHYNKDSFRAAGLNPDRPPKTIEELNAMAERLTVKGPDGKYERMGFMPAEPGWWSWAWGYFFGGSLYDGNARITANSKENVRAFEWIAQWSKRFGGTSLNAFKTGLGNFSSPQNGFLDGQVAMELQGVWMYNFIHIYAPQLDGKWSAVAFPYPSDRPDLANSTIGDEDCLVIPRGSRHPDEAFDFIKFVQSRRGMELLCMKQAKHTPLKEASADFWKNHPNPLARFFADLARSPNVITSPKLGFWPEYKDAMTNAFDEVSLEKKTAKEALDAVQVRMQARLDDLLMRRRLRDTSEGVRNAETSPSGTPLADGIRNGLGRSR